MPQISRKRRFLRDPKDEETEKTTTTTTNPVSTAVIITLIIICLLVFVWWISIYVRATRIENKTGSLIVILANTFISPVVGEISLQYLK